MSAYNRFIHIIFISLFISICINAKSIAQKRNKIDSLKKITTQALQNSSVDTNSIKTFLKISRYYQRRDTLKALKYARLAEKWSTKLNYSVGLANSYRYKGNVYTIQGKFNKSLVLYDKALSIYKKYHYEKGIAASYVDLGGTYSRLGDIDRSLDYTLKAIPEYKTLKDTANLSRVYTNIGIFYYQNKDYKRAHSYFNLALDYFKNKNNPQVLGMLYNNIGVLLRDEKKTDEALHYHLEAEKIRKKIGDINGLAFSYFNIGNIYKDKKNYKLALKYHFKSVAIRKKQNYTSDLSYSYYEIGSIYLSENKSPKALTYADKAFKLAIKSSSLKNQERALNLKTDIYSHLGQYKKAFLYNKKYHIVRDSLINYKKSKKFAELTNKYEARGKEQEIKLLKKEKSFQHAELKKAETLRDSLFFGSALLFVTLILLTTGYRAKKNSEKELQQKNKDLEQANDLILQNEKIMEKQALQLKKANDILSEKNKQLTLLDESKNDFFRIAAHDLKNPLLGISSLTSMMLDNKYDDQKSLKSIREQLHLIHRSSKDMTNLIGQLLKVNEIDSNSLIVNTTAKNITDLIKAVIDHQKTIAKSKSINISYQTLPDDLEAIIDETAFRQILDNILSNAIKFSSYGQPVSLNADKKGEKVLIKITDYGPGITENERAKLFEKFSRLTPRPTNGESSTGIGLYIAKKLVDAMNGDIWCESTVGEGTTFFIELPASV